MSASFDPLTLIPSFGQVNMDAAANVTEQEFEYLALNHIDQIAASSRPSSLGALDVLPTELMHRILNELDIDSVIRLMQTSLCGKHLVDGLVSFSRLRDHAFTAPVTLVKTRTSQLFTTKKILKLIPSLRAQQIFGFTGKQIKTLDKLHSIPRSILGGGTKHFVLVSARQAKQFAMDIHGYEAALKQHMDDLVETTRSKGRRWTKPGRQSRVYGSALYQDATKPGERRSIPGTARIPV
ncbi:MAG: hypothetical protein MMC23_008739 [Stictis urceolatum]|nr:hypothetical protein [Stictis urceolata]